MSEKTEKIGVFGGTFNPPHLGHRLAAERFIDFCGLDKLIVMPAGIPPHKKLPDITPSDSDRLKMCELAFGDIAEISRLELEREGKSYTYDTLQALKNRFPKDKLFLYIGSDMLFILESWYNFKKLPELAVLVTTDRTGSKKQELINECSRLKNEYGFTVEIMDFAPIVLSSTDVRTNNLSKTAQIPKNVLKYIKEKNLYK